VALDVWTLIGACVLVGLGVGVYRPLGLSILIAAGGTTRKARYIAVHETAAALASFAGAAFIGVSLGWFGWRTALLLFCVVGVVALLVFTRLQDRESRMMAGTREPVPIDRTLAFSCIAFTACNMMNAGLISVLPLIMVRAWAIDPGYAAWTLGWAKLANMAGVLVAGARADTWGQGRVLRWSQILTIAGCLAMSVGGFGPSFLA
jgi:MFS family permease